MDDSTLNHIQDLLNKRVVNLSSTILTDSELKLLRKGLNFCPTPLSIDFKDIQSDITNFARKLSLKEYFSKVTSDSDHEQTTDTYTPSTLHFLNKPKRNQISKPSREPVINAYVDMLRHDFQSIRKQRPKLKRDNLSTDERKALISLKNRTDIVIKPADKGGAVVIQDLESYVAEGYRQLNDDKFYTKLDSDLTAQHEMQVNNLIDQLHSQGEINEELSELLKQSQSRTPILYFLPKIHKKDNPGRPVVSSVGCHTEKISAYLDNFLKPLARKLPSYVKDTTDFIKIITTLPNLPKGTILVTMDVSSLYTNIDNSEGIRAAREALNKAKQHRPTPEALCKLLEKVLSLNNFTFNEEHFLQIKGTAMGTRVAPNYANIFMGKFEETYVYNSDWMKTITCWKRYIDDIFLVWQGSESHLLEFFKYIDTVHPTIKFQHEYSTEAINFLDINVRVNQDGSLSTDVYQKPTDTHSYMNWVSAHPRHLKFSVPYSQALRLRRICSSDITLRKRIDEYTHYFLASGYKLRTVKEQMERVLTMSQKDALCGSRRITSTGRTNFTTVYSPHLNNIGKVINQRWDLLQTKGRLKKIFNDRPLIVYRRPQSIKDCLVSAKIKRQPMPIPRASLGSKPCKKPRCTWCPLIAEGKEFRSEANGFKYKMFHDLNCHSSWVIYIITCMPCKKQYVGKSETPLNIRLNNHRNHIKNRLETCELAEHFIRSPQHDFSRDVCITPIETITKNLELEKKKSVLKERERFWISKLKTIQPSGINKRYG